TNRPRMADFAAWGFAAEPALGWPSGAFLAAYLDNRAAANTTALDESVLAPLIVALLTGRDRWQGTASDLLAALETRTDEKTRKRRDWPATPRKLAGDLRRLAPNLRRASVSVAFDREPGGQRRRTIRLEATGIAPSLSSLPSRGPAGEEQNGGKFQDKRDE